MTQVRVLAVASTQPLDVASLTASERSEYDSLSTTGRRGEWLRSRRALRFALACSGLPTDTTGYRFPHPRLSLSHTERIGVAAVAIGDIPNMVTGIGVDVEESHPADPRAARFFLGDHERAHASGSAHQVRMWTVKEALFKSDPDNGEATLIDYRLDRPESVAGTARRLDVADSSFGYTSGLLRGAHLTAAAAITTEVHTLRSCTPMADITFDAVTARIYELLSVPAGSLTPETTVRELVADSFQLVEMVIDLQEEFDVIFTQNELREVVTIGDLVTLLQAQEVGGPHADAN